MTKIYRLITMFAFLTVSCGSFATAEPLQLPVSQKGPNKQLAHSKAVSLIGQAKKMVQQESASIQIVGRALTAAEKQRLGQLAAAASYLQSAEAQLAGRPPKIDPVSFAPTGGKPTEDIFFVTVDGKLRRSPNAFSATIPYLDTRFFYWRLILPTDEQLAERVANYIKSPGRDHPARVTGHVRILPKQRRKDGTVATEYHLLVTSIQVGRRELVGVTSPDGKLLVVGHDNGELNIFDARDGKLKANYAGLDAERLAPSQAASWLPQVLFSPTSHTLAIQRGTEGVLLWSPRTGKLIHLLVKNGLVGMRIGKFSADGRFLLVHASGPKGRGPGALVVYDSYSSQQVLQVQLPAGKPYAAVDFASTGKSLVTIDAAGKATAWNLIPKK